MHTQGNHWIAASTILSFPGTVTVYNPLNDEIDFETFCIILKLLGDSSNCLKLEIAKVQKQHGTINCGLLAIANAVLLARKQDPTKATSDDAPFDQLFYSRKNETISKFSITTYQAAR